MAAEAAAVSTVAGGEAAGFGQAASRVQPRLALPTRTRRVRKGPVPAPSRPVPVLAPHPRPGQARGPHMGPPTAAAAAAAP